MQPAPASSSPRLSFEHKQRLALLLLCAALVWPAIHFLLYRTHGIDPWRLCGWAMYARPRAAHHLAITTLHGTEERRLDSLPPTLLALADSTVRQRSALGSLAGDDDLAQAILAAVPDSDGVRLVWQRTDFDCGSGYLGTPQEDSRTYWREAIGVAGSPPARP